MTRAQRAGDAGIPAATRIGMDGPQRAQGKGSRLGPSILRRVRRRYWVGDVLAFRTEWPRKRGNQGGTAGMIFPVLETIYIVSRTGFLFLKGALAYDAANIPVDAMANLHVHRQTPNQFMKKERGIP